MIPVNEVFQTVQGEATWTGTPSVFVRLQGCPVGCPWCDTKHTWEVEARNAVGLPDMLEKKGEETATFGQLTEGDIAKVVCGFKAGHVVLTGGEPCLYDLRTLTRALEAVGRFVQVETSGTQEVRVSDATWVTVSPKIAMPGGYKVLASALSRANEIKHPVGKLADVERLANLLDEHGISDKPVWLAPLSQSEKATALCVAEATERGWRVSIQTHKYLGVR